MLKPEEVLKLAFKGEYSRIDEYILDALGKEVPKRPKLDYCIGGHLCPSCDEVVEHDYCPWCGQAIKWI